jgi:DNA ligase-1
VHQSRPFLPILIHVLFQLIAGFCEQLCPDYTGIELGIGESLLVKAIGESTGRSLQLIKADLKKEGDLGLVAMVRKCLFSHVASI